MRDTIVCWTTWIALVVSLCTLALNIYTVGYNAGVMAR